MSRSSLGRKFSRDLKAILICVLVKRSLERRPLQEFLSVI